MKEITAGDTSPTRQHSSTDLTKVIFSERPGPKQFSLDDHLTNYQKESFSESAAEFPYRRSEQQIPLTKLYDTGRAIRSTRSFDNGLYAERQSEMRDKDRIEVDTLVEATRARIDEVKQEIEQVKKSLAQVNTQYQLARTDCQLHCQKFKLTLHEEGRLIECADTKYNNAKKEYDNEKKLYDNLYPEPQRSHTSKLEKTASQEDYAGKLDELRGREKFFNTKTEDLIAQKTNLEERLKNLNDQGSELDIQKSDEEKKLLSTKDSSRQLNAKLKDLENKLKMLEANKTNWEESLSQMRAKLARVEEQLTELKEAEENIQFLQTQIDPLKKEISEEEKKLDKLQQHVDNLDKVLDEKGKKAEEITAAQGKKKLLINDLKHPERIIHSRYIEFLKDKALSSEDGNSSEDEFILGEEFSTPSNEKEAARKIDVLETFAKSGSFDVETSEEIKKLSKQLMPRIRLKELEFSAIFPDGYDAIVAKINSYKENEGEEKYKKIINQPVYQSKEKDLERERDVRIFPAKNEEDYSKLQKEANDYQQKFIKVTKRMNSMLNDFTKLRASGEKETVTEAKKFIDSYYEQQNNYIEFNIKQTSMEVYLKFLIRAEENKKIKEGAIHTFTEIDAVFEKNILNASNPQIKLKNSEVINGTTSDLQKLERDFEDVEKIISLFEVRKAEEGKKITSSENSLREHNTRLASIEQEITDHQNLSLLYQKTKDRLEKDIANTESKLEGENYSKDSLEKLEKELGELRQEKTVVTTRIDEEEKSVATLVQQLQEIQGKKERSTEEYGRVSTELDLATSSLKSIKIKQEALGRLQGNYNTMQEAFNDIKAIKEVVKRKYQKKEEKESIETQIQDLEIKLEATKKKFRILQFS